MKNEKILTFEEYEEIAKKLKEHIDNNFTKEEYEQMMRLSNVAKKQEQDIEFLVDHYYDAIYPKDYNDKKIDRRFAYYDIIEVCLKKLKQTDKSFELFFNVTKEKKNRGDK